MIWVDNPIFKLDIFEKHDTASMNSYTHMLMRHCRCFMMLQKRRFGTLSKMSVKIAVQIVVNSRNFL